MIRINLLPIRELQKQAQLRQQLYVFAAIVGVVVIGVALLWIMDMRALAA